LHDLIRSEPLAETVPGGRLFGAGSTEDLIGIRGLKMVKFVRKDDGLVTIEWVGIAAVMVLAAIAITAYVMQGTDGAAQHIGKGVESVAKEAADPAGPGRFGNGQADEVVNTP
jgi:hypothetical protein